MEVRRDRRAMQHGRIFKEARVTTAAMAAAAATVSLLMTAAAVPKGRIMGNVAVTVDDGAAAVNMSFLLLLSDVWHTRRQLFSHSLYVCPSVCVCAAVVWQR